MTPSTAARLPRHGAVIKHNLQPIAGVMTDITGLGGGDMVRAFATGDAAVMTVLTQIRGLAVINWHEGGQPRVSAVAGFTHITGQRMAC